MKKTYAILLFIFFSLEISAQEFLADVSVDYSQVQGSNNQVYQTLEKSLKNFINNTKWTDLRYKLNEKIEASFLIIINDKEGSNNYKASIQIQSRRPIFNSTYYSPTLNFMDKNFNFEYTEFEELIFNERKFSGKNLTDVITFYIYFILGTDADSFQKQGGTKYFKTAQAIANNANGQRFSGWSELDGPRSRTSLINDVLGEDNSILRDITYEYYRKGLDIMAKSEVNAKNLIGKTLTMLEYYERGNFAQFYPLDLFIQAHKNEIAKIFSGGLVSSADIPKIQRILNSLSPTNSEIWNNLKK